LVAGQDDKKKELEQEYILIPICTTDPLISQGTKDSAVDAGKKAPEVDKSEASDNGGKNDQEHSFEQFSPLKNAFSLPHVPIVTPIDDTGIFDNVYDDEVLKEEVDMNNGHTQEEGIDYDEVFAPVARIEAIRLFLAYASFKDFVVYQMNVKSAFLYGRIEEEVYVCQPPGFKDPNFPDKVYKVEKALYGLHQAPRAWFQVTLKTLHLHAVKRIFRYLKGQPKLGIWYPKDSPFDLEAYSDSDYVGASLDRKSTTGGCQFLRKRLISWQCKKQTIVANSTTEAEYIDDSKGWEMFCGYI
nr:putative RNA-directed DNA polymerase [Tanacetum cinerariifolium]